MSELNKLIKNKMKKYNRKERNRRYYEKNKKKILNDKFELRQTKQKTLNQVIKAKITKYNRKERNRIAYLRKKERLKESLDKKA